MAVRYIIGIVGSRDYPDEVKVRNYVRSLPTNTIVVSGGRTSIYWPRFRGRGVDVWAANEAEQCKLTLIEHPPNPNNGIPACFHIRNGLIVDEVKKHINKGLRGYIVAFSKQPITPGTQSTINQANNKGVQVIIEPISWIE